MSCNNGACCINNISTKTCCETSNRKDVLLILLERLFEQEDAIEGFPELVERVDNIVISATDFSNYVNGKIDSINAEFDDVNDELDSIKARLTALETV